MARSKDQRVIRRAAKALDFVRLRLEQEESSMAKYNEMRYSRQDDVEAWGALGYRVFTVWDSHTFSTSSDPFYSAHSAIRYAREELDKLGYCTMTECPDVHYIRWFDSYWGTHQSQKHGHIVLLVRAETPADLEAIRRHWLDHNTTEWRTRHNMDFPHSGFREWR